MKQERKFIAFDTNAFALTFAFAQFYFLTEEQKQKRVQANAQRQCRQTTNKFSADRHCTTDKKERRAATNSTLPNIAGSVVIESSCY